MKLSLHKSPDQCATHDGHGIVFYVPVCIRTKIMKLAERPYLN